MCVLGACKLNVVVREGYFDEALKFIAKIPIKIELDMCMYVHACKSNIVVHEGYLDEALNFTTKIPINSK